MGDILSFFGNSTVLCTVPGISTGIQKMSDEQMDSFKLERTKHFSTHLRETYDSPQCSTVTYILEPHL